MIPVFIIVVAVMITIFVIIVVAVMIAIFVIGNIDWLG